MDDEIDITGLKDSKPKEAPVQDPEPLTGKEKAGVYLTWGIIGVLVFFLTVILGIFVWGESEYLGKLSYLESFTGSTPEQSAEATKLAETLNSQLASFRAHWFDTLQIILLNVLFPTLTALLGYVFGTSRNGNS